MKQKVSSKEQDLLIKSLKNHLNENGYQMKILKSDYELGHHTILILNEIRISCWFKIAFVNQKHPSNILELTYSTIFDGSPIDSVNDFAITYDLIQNYAII